jgi:molecular chaperone DnaK
VPSRRTGQPPPPPPAALRLPSVRPFVPELPSLTSTLPMPLSGPDAVRSALGTEKPPPGGTTQGMPSADPAATIPKPVAYADILRSTMLAAASTEAAGTEAPAAPLEAEASTQAGPSGMPAPLAQAPVLVDVTPRALVVETVGGWCDVVVQRNAKIPCERTRAFTTSGDMQTVVRVRVAQGEDAVFERNTFLGEVELVGLRAAPRGEVTIRARFEVDESGTLKIFATDVATGRQAHALLQLVGIAEAASVAAMKARHAATQVN